MPNLFMRVDAWAKAHAKYLGVIAASIVFGSWAVTSFLSEGATRAENRFSAVASAQTTVDWQRAVDTKLSNLEKELLRSRDLRAPTDISKLSAGHQRLYNWSLELEYNQSFLDDWTKLKEQADFVDGLSATAGAPFWIAHRVAATRERILVLYAEYLQARDAYLAASAPLHEATSYKDIPESKAHEIAEAAKRYRDAIQHSEINSEYITLKNTLLRSEGEIRRWASGALTVWSLLASVFRVIALALYALGTSLAIYGKWLEAKPKEAASANAS